VICAHNLLGVLSAFLSFKTEGFTESLQSLALGVIQPARAKSLVRQACGLSDFARLPSTQSDACGVLHPASWHRTDRSVGDDEPLPFGFLVIRAFHVSGDWLFVASCACGVDHPASWSFRLQHPPFFFLSANFLDSIESIVLGVAQPASPIA